MENKLLFSLKEIESITGGKWVNFDEKLVIDEFVHLLPHIKDGDLFIVHYANWYNKKTDNEKDIPRAIKKGARALMVQKQTDISNLSMPVLVVDDTYYALKNLALYASEKASSKRVVITGSYGKTGFKNHLYHLIKDKTKVFARLSSSNRVASTYGNLASLKKDTEVLLVEIPISTRNKTQRRAGYVRPDICVITSIGHEHIERHASVNNIIKKKCSIAGTLPEEGKIIVPSDGEYSDLIKKELRKYEDIEVLTFGYKDNCNAQLLSVWYENYRYKVIARIEEELVQYEVPFVDDHAPLSSICELLCIKHLGFDIYECAKNYKNIKNFRSSGNLYKLEYKEKTFYLYDHSRRGGVEGYRSFLKTIKKINPKGKGRKIFVTSEFVDIQDGEEKFIDKNEFKQLIEEASIDQFYTVENFKAVHEDLISDKKKWIQHSLKVEDLRENFLNNIHEGDVICIKAIFESSLQLLSKDILHNSEILNSQQEYNTKVDLLKNCRIIDTKYMERFYSIMDNAKKENWVNYFPFLYTFSASKSRKILLNFEDDVMSVYFLRHLNSRRREPFLQLYFIPIPFSSQKLKKALTLVKEFNHASSNTILWCDAEDIKRVRENKEFDKVIKFRYKESEFIYSPQNYETLSGSKYKYLRRQIGWINALKDVKVTSYKKEHLKDCLSLYDDWKKTQGLKYESIEDESYTKLCLYHSFDFPKEILDGIVVLIDNQVKSFAFYGKITNEISNMFIAKSDHSIRGLQVFTNYQILLRLEDYKYANASGGDLSKGLYESKKNSDLQKCIKFIKGLLNLVFLDNI